MSPQEIIDEEYEKIVKYLRRAANHADNDRDISMAVSYGAAHATWDSLNEHIIKYGVLPSKWKLAK